MSTAEVMSGIEEADSESAHADVLPFPSQHIQRESSSVETDNIYPTQVESLTTESFLSANAALPEAVINELDCLGLRWDEDTLVIGAPKESWQRIRDYA